MIRIRHLVVAVSAFGAVLATADALASSQLAAKGGCGACHMAERKLVGPSYKDIAAKYKDRPDAVAYLSQRVRKGGPGNWGSVPMAPTDLSKLNDAEIKTVVGWILATPQ